MKRFKVSKQDQLSVIFSNIFRCTWQGNSCDTENYFNVTVTDLGVCYTFNGDLPTLTVTEPGILPRCAFFSNRKIFKFTKESNIVPP